MTIHPLFTVHTLRPFHVVFSNVLDCIEAEWSIETFSTLSFAVREDIQHIDHMKHVLLHCWVL